MIGHAVQLATKGILGSLSTLGYIIGFTIVETVEPPVTPEPPIAEIPYVSIGGSGGGHLGLPGKPAKKKKTIRITFWHDGEVYEQINSVDEDLLITMSDLTLIAGPDSKPVVALKSFSKMPRP